MASDRLHEQGYDTPEEAALSGWAPVSQARVVRTRVHPLDPDRVDVIVDTEPSHLMRVFTVRHGEQWMDTGDASE
ncbi:MAG: hypothetical protein ACRDY2_05645 [Acidimicrobiales bacterium]